jgi:hypothetical protein
LRYKGDVVEAEPLQPRGGLGGESENIVGRLNRRIRRMRAVAEAMKGLLEDVEDRGRAKN